MVRHGGCFFSICDVSEVCPGEEVEMTYSLKTKWRGLLIEDEK